MSLIELLKTAIQALSTNKVRTGLTMLGIIIGIASVITMLGIGSGAQASIQSSVTALGTNVLTISSSGQFSGVVRGAAGAASTLTMDDATALSQVQGVSAVSPETQSQAQIIAGQNNTNTIVYGVTPSYALVHNYQIQAGGFIVQSQVDSLSRVAVIGPDTATTLFGTNSPIGQSIMINHVQFNIIGETVPKGSNGFASQDDFVIIPLTTAQQIVFGMTNLRSIAIQASSADVVSQVQNDVTTLLLTRHSITNPQNADFIVRNSATTLSTLSSITNVFTILLASIASISLLVGGIGIMNIMIVTVTERTREIGLRKAIGAKNATILQQFLIEAILLTLSSGILGILLGFSVGSILTHITLTSVLITPFAIILSTGISFLIGIIFGLYPAYKASRLIPIEALRYE